jgi:general secretion pathway protein A
MLTNDEASSKKAREGKSKPAGNAWEDMEPDLNDLAGDGAEGPGPIPVSASTIHEASFDVVQAFKLAAQPFSDNVNPEFFFRAKAHEDAFLAMKQCIEDHVSMGLVTALSGAGKTLLTQVLLQDLDPRRYKTILVLGYPGMTRSALLRELVEELKLEGLPRRPNTHAMITAIQEHIIQLYLKGTRLVVIIDEVHFLRSDALQVLRTLSNVEVPEQKLVTLLLFGERGFLDKLQRPAYKSIYSRMFARVDLRTLDRAEVEQYVKYRIMIAAGTPNLFSADGLDRVYAISEGIPREINRVCFVSLGEAARQGARQVTGETIDQLHQDGRI